MEHPCQAQNFENNNCNQADSATEERKKRKFMAKAAYNKIYYERNREKILEKKKNYRQQHNLKEFIRKRYHSDPAFRQRQIEHTREYRKKLKQKSSGSQTDEQSQDNLRAPLNKENDRRNAETDLDDYFFGPIKVEFFSDSEQSHDES
jgi:hypothetical protein